MIVGTGTGVEQVTVYKVNLGILIPSPQEELLLAVNTGRLKGCSLHRLQGYVDADVCQICLNDGCDLLIRSTGCIG